MTTGTQGWPRRTVVSTVIASVAGISAARRLGAERVIAMSRHEPRQKVAEQFGATHVVAERGEEGEQRILDLTDGVGADVGVIAVRA